MSQTSASISSGAPSGHAADEITAPLLLTVYTCNRLGRVANPPSFSFSDWFRSVCRR
jgi:hypothetical protein